MRLPLIARALPVAAVAALCALAAPLTRAALPVGAAAPDFTADAALAGKTFKFSLAESLKKGPVVLYFYPKAFTSGCTIEAHNFAEATPKFQALGATVIGMSNDDIPTLQKFSTEHCRDKFAVAADNGGAVMKQYDAVMLSMPRVSDRVSYVISPEGKVIFSFANLSPDGHVESTLAAVQKWKDAH